jgi:hypothetical protein
MNRQLEPSYASYPVQYLSRFRSSCRAGLQARRPRTSLAPSSGTAICSIHRLGFARGFGTRPRWHNRATYW